MEQITRDLLRRFFFFLQDYGEIMKDRFLTRMSRIERSEWNGCMIDPRVPILNQHGSSRFVTVTAIFFFFFLLLNDFEKFLCS